MTRYQKAFDSIDQFAERSMKDLLMPGLAIALTDREKLLRVSTYGFADVAAQIPITPDTMFETGSLGKPFTNIALLQLRDEGKLDLHAPVTQYLPWFRVRSDYPPITTHHLMNHTAGLVRGTDLAPHGLYEAWALREMQTGAPPGDYFAYSSIGYKVLGFLLEELTGQSYQDAIQSRFLDPLGMTHTHPVITFETRKKAAIGYCGLYDDRPEHPSHGLVPAIWSEYGTGDGCQASTPADMTIYLRMLLNRGQGPQGRLMSEESFDLLTHPGVWTGCDYYGYALAMYTVHGHTYLGHGGANASFMSAVMMDMEEGLGLIFLINRTGDSDTVVEAAQHALAILRAVHRHEEIPRLPPDTASDEVPNAPDYTGVYRTGNRALHLTAEEGR
ncbi:MAG: beta-lactamase family protein, partial [Candidatus Tectomicrobia bacterium]|nr:beta-lactamase family protein [Candidatus Tectomicrobia bacterium]